MTLVLLLARSPSTYVLTQEVGDFALSGQQAGLLSGWMLSANTGSFTFTGQDAIFRYFNLASEAGSFSLGGQDAGLNRGQFIAADAGSFTLTGQNVFLTADPIMTAEPYRQQQGGGLLLALLQSVEGFIVSAGGADISATRIMPASSASFELTGNDAALSVNMPADTGAFTLTFNTVQLTPYHFITAEAGAYILTGNAASLSSAWSSQVDLFRTRTTFTADAMFTRDR